jgi:branched-chain amino acid transport system permease protein
LLLELWSEVLVFDLIQYLVDGLAVGSVYALIALGYSMVFGVLQLVNFAHGELFMVGAYFVMYAISLGLPWPMALFLGMVFVGLFAVIMERLCYKPLRGAGKLAPLITAVGLSLLLQNLVQAILGPNPQSYPVQLPEGKISSALYSVFGSPDQIVLPQLPEGLFDWENLVIRHRDLLIFVVAVGVTLALELFLRKTRPGRGIRALALQPNAARLVGVPFDFTISLTFFIGAALAVVAGLLQGMADNQVTPYMGITSGLKAFAAAVLGGIGVIPGALVGGLVLGIAERLLVGYDLSTYKDGAAFFILILVLLLRPQGLLGKARMVKV